jgi:hypothetical protein
MSESKKSPTSNQDGVMPRFLAIGTLSNGKSFRYEDTAKDMLHFINFIFNAYPTFEIEVVVNVA